MLPALWRALITPYTDNVIFDTLPWLKLPKPFWLALMPCVPLLLSAVKAYPFMNMKKLSLSLATLELICAAVIYASFFTAFYGESSVYAHNYRNKDLVTIGSGALYSAVAAWMRHAESGSYPSRSVQRACT